MALKINSENRNKKRRIDLSKAEKVAKTALKMLKKGDIELNVVFFSNQKMRALNRAYLGVDAATDVIAFPAEASSRFMGDIAISSDKAAQNAVIYGVTFNEEMALCLIHGILHLAGYKDTARKDQKAMRKKENELLQKVRKFL